MDLPPSAPILSRQQSISTNQGNKGTCMAHSFAKVLLQNIYRFVYPMTVPPSEIDNFQSCFSVLSTNDKDMQRHLSEISRDKCGRAGYDKILLFIYLYNLVECNRSPQTQTQEENVNKQFINALQMNEPFENFFHGRNAILFGELRAIITKKIQVQKLNWIIVSLNNNNPTPESTRILHNILVKILSLGLYVLMGMYLSEESKLLRNREDENPPGTDVSGHAVVMVKYENGFFNITNSWGKRIETTRDVNNLQIKNYMLHIVSYSFVLPIYDNDIQFPLPNTSSIEPIDWSVLERWTHNYGTHIQQYRHEFDLENLSTANEDIEPKVRGEPREVDPKPRVGPRAGFEPIDRPRAGFEPREFDPKPRVGPSAGFEPREFDPKPRVGPRAGFEPRAYEPRAYEPRAGFEPRVRVKPRVKSRVGVGPRGDPIAYEPIVDPRVDPRARPRTSIWGGRKYKTRKYKKRKFLTQKYFK